MHIKSGMMLKILLNRYHPNPPQQLFKSLSKEQVAFISSIDTQMATPANVGIEPRKLFHQIHYSWLISYFEKLPLSSLPMLIAALPRQQAEKIRKHFNVDPLSLRTKAKSYLQQQLYRLITPPEVLPNPLLPENELSSILKFSKLHLVMLIDMLGMYDLADEVRMIIDKEQINKINACLHPHQKQFLRQCLYQKEKLVSTSLNLKQWDGDGKKLLLLLHYRGLLRLSKALAGQHPDFIWYLAHLLDKGRGEFLIRHHSPAVVPRITPALIQQILVAMNFLNSGLSRSSSRTT